MKLITTKINSKLTICSITINAGSSSEEKISCNHGTAHFLEHMIFKGSESMPYDVISRKMAELGADMNAYTTYGQTTYYFEVPTKNLDKCLDIFSDIIKNPLLSVEDIDKERLVILEEATMYEEDHSSFFYYEACNIIYKNILNRNILGTKESISSISREDLKKFHESFYKTNHMLISVVSSLGKEDIHNKIEKFFGKIDDSFDENILVSEISDWEKERFFIERDGVTQSHGEILFRCPSIYSKENLSALMLSMIMGDGMDSRLFFSIREEKNLVYSISSRLRSDKHTGLFSISFLSTSPDEVISEVYKECQNAVSKGFSEEELIRAKNKYKTGLYRSFEDKRFLSSRKESSILNGKKRVLSLNSLEKKIDAITVDMVLDVAKKIFLGKTTAIVMSEKDEKSVA